jgi:hypothetical protein
MHKIKQTNVILHCHCRHSWHKDAENFVLNFVHGLIFSTLKNLRTLKVTTFEGCIFFHLQVKREDTPSVGSIRTSYFQFQIRNSLVHHIQKTRCLSPAFYLKTKEDPTFETVIFLRFFHRPGDGGSTHLWNIGLLQWDWGCPTTRHAGAWRRGDIAPTHSWP